MKMHAIDFITGSTNKFEEVQKLLPDVALSQLVIDLPEIQEIDPHKIIRAKLEAAYVHSPNGVFIIEDTSFYLDALPGLPGPLVKWFLETIGVSGLVDIAEKFGNSAAAAKGIIGYAESREKIYFFEGEVRGTVVRPRADNGFGWDLIFVPLGHTKTFAEMTQDEKNTVSHRGRAATKLAQFLLV